jgi:AmiR/NasT family two-component response regulator
VAETATSSGGALEDRDLPEPARVLMHRLQTRSVGGGKDPRWRMHEGPEVVDGPEPDVDDVPTEPKPPGVARETEHEEPACVAPGRADEQIGIRIAADDTVHHHHVGWFDLGLRNHEIAVYAPDSLREAAFGEQCCGFLVVALGDLDDRRLLRTLFEQLDVDRADPSADLEHARALDPPLGELVHHPTRGLVEAIIRLDLRELLERAGFEVCAEAKDGFEAVELARSQRPDLAVLDVKMPRLDGIEAARRILDERPIPIVMLTAYGQDELVSRAIEAGVFGYLVKPFREQDLLPAIHTARARHEELAALREQADSLAEALAARKAIERAKGLLMTREGLTEQDAFARLRKASQLSGRPMKVVAEALIATFGEGDAG